ncbi:MAG TPA: NAD(P)-dependent oxidoreductase [Nitrososphaeraceae archaeon]|nr:NAD(P)-dependent oxidoreductase [Nitrososphaeraceae archaeon]
MFYQARYECGNNRSWFNGSQLATRLIETEHSVMVYNRDISKTKPFAKLNAKVANTPKQLAENCGFIIICVTNFKAVKEVCFGTHGIITATHCKNLIVADSSNISPKESIYNAQLFRKMEIEMLGMPLMGGPAAAKRGELVSIITGKKQAFEKTKHIIRKIASSVFYTGNVDGSANAIKLALNLNIALIACAVSGVTLVRGLGINPEIFIKILNSTYFKTGLSEIKGPKMVKNKFNPTFYLRNMLKDLELVTNTAQDIGFSLHIATITQQIYRQQIISDFPTMTIQQY